MRAVLARVPLRVYERFDAERVLHDAEVRRATHISVVDKMLQDMLSVEEGRMAKAAGRRPCAAGGLPGRDATPVRPPAAAGGEAAGRGADAGATRLAMYRCVLLGGAALNPQTIDRALGLGVRVFASYGMTETSSQIANSLVTDEFTGGMKLLDWYPRASSTRMRRGSGGLRCAVPACSTRYLNAHAAFTVDGFFLTGDTAALHDGCIYVKERTGDMFVSGRGERLPSGNRRRPAFGLRRGGRARVRRGRRRLGQASCGGGGAPRARPVRRGRLPRRDRASVEAQHAR